MRCLGVSDTTIGRLCERGVLRVVDRGVFMSTTAPDTPDTRLWIAVLGGRGVLGFASAAHLWQMDELPRQVHLIVGSQRRISPRDDVRRHHVFVPAAARTTIRGLPVTTQSWTLLDHVGRLRFGTALRLVDRGAQQGWVRIDDIARRLADYPGRQGNTMLRRVLSVAGDGAAAESERVLHRLLHGAGLRGWRVNHRIVTPVGTIIVIDVAFVRARLAIEVDGMAYHVDTDRFVQDRRRQNQLVALGWTVLRFTWWDLTDRPDEVLATIRARL
jgi:very-short-patch-repair endonuclease